MAPFTTWPFQDRDFPFVLRCIEDQVNLVCQKSRDMGFSWKNLIICDWLDRFHPYKKIGMISRSEKAVEDEDPDSLFWKLDFIHAHLPEWLHQPDKFIRRKMFFGYPNGSTLTGQASTGKAFVGGRATAIFIDEFAQIKEDWEVLHRTSDSSYCRIFNSTHLGLGTAFYKMCFDEESFPEPRWRRLCRHWIDHPEKGKGTYRFDESKNQIQAIDKTYSFPADYQFIRSPEPTGGPHPGIRSVWYDWACADKGNNARAIAMDLDINPQGSVSQVFNPLKIAYLKAKFAVPPYWQGDLVFDAKSKEPIAPLELVRQEDGPLRLWCHPNSGKVKPSLYKIGCDLATGNGATNSCIQVIDAKTAEKVASYTTPSIKPEILARVAVLLCGLFADEYGQGAELVWECPGPGLLFSEVVIDLGYRNIYYRTAEEKTGPNLRQRARSETPGWFQSNDGKRFLIDRYNAALEAEKYITREEEELTECLAFRWTNDGRSVEHSGETNGDDPSGARTNHGDRVIAASLAWMLAQGEGGVVLEEKSDEGPPPGSLAYRRQLNDNCEVQPDEPLWIGGVEYR